MLSVQTAVWQAHRRQAALSFPRMPCGSSAFRAVDRRCPCMGDHRGSANMCAYTLFNGYRYCATIEQADKADIYVVDVDGVKRFKERYVKHNPARQIFVVYLDTPEWELKKRMTHRGDSPEKINSRLQHDREAFKEAADIADHILDGRVEVDLNAMYLYNLVTGQLGHYTDA